MMSQELYWMNPSMVFSIVRCSCNYNSYISDETLKSD